VKVSNHELRKRYQSLDTEELLELRRGGTLTEAAASVMEEVLVSRGVISQPHPESFAEVGEVKAALNSLLDLSDKTAKKNAAARLDWRDIARGSVQRTSEARAYCSRTLLKDFTDSTPKPKDHILIRWRLDFVKPDRWHVIQEAWEAGGTLYDQYIIVGSETYQNVGMWVQAEREGVAELNRSLLVNSMLAILQYEGPKNSAVYDYLGEQYLLLEYPQPTSPERQQGFLRTLTGLKGTCQIQLWVSLKTGFLAKGAILFDGTVDKERVHGEIHQVFTSYNEDIHVDPPPWVNTVPRGDGRHQIVNRKVPIILPHGAEGGPATSSPPQSTDRVRAAFWAAILITFGIALLVNLCTG